MALNIPLNQSPIMPKVVVVVVVGVVVVVVVVMVSASSMDNEASVGQARPVPSRHRTMIEVIFIFMMLSGAKVAE